MQCGEVGRAEWFMSPEEPRKLDRGRAAWHGLHFHGPDCHRAKKFLTSPLPASSEYMVTSHQWLIIVMLAQRRGGLARVHVYEMFTAPVVHISINIISTRHAYQPSRRTTFDIESSLSLLMESRECRPQMSMSKKKKITFIMVQSDCISLLSKEGGLKSR